MSDLERIRTGVRDVFFAWSILLFLVEMTGVLPRFCVVLQCMYLALLFSYAMVSVPAWHVWVRWRREVRRSREQNPLDSFDR